MDKKIIKDIITNLKEEEGAESHLISLYLALLDAGVDLCLPESRRAQFRKNLTIVQKESEHHKKIVDTILEKFQTA